MHPSPTPRPALTGLELALRNRAIISWVNQGRLLPGATLPGTGNTLADLSLGFASFAGIPLCELVPADETEAWLWDYTPEFLSYLWDHFGRQIRAWTGWGLDSAGLLA